MLDLRSVQRDHRRFLAAHDSAVARSLNDAREAGLGLVMSTPGFKPRTGELQRATTGQVIRNSRGALVRLQNRKPYAAPIDKGARAHPITAHGRALRFVGAGGAVIFRRSVNHPGNRPYHFLRNATTGAARTFELLMTSRMRAAARQF